MSSSGAACGFAEHVAELKSITRQVLTKASNQALNKRIAWEYALVKHAVGAAHCLGSFGEVKSRHTLQDAAQAAMALVNLLTKHTFSTERRCKITCSALQLTDALPAAHSSLRRSVHECTADCLAATLRAASSGQEAAWGHAGAVLQAAAACKHMQHGLPFLHMQILQACSVSDSSSAVHCLWDTCASLHGAWAAPSTQPLHAIPANLPAVVQSASSHLVRHGVLPPPTVLPFLPGTAAGPETGSGSSPGLLAPELADALAQRALEQLQVDGSIQSVVRSLLPVVSAGLLRPQTLQAVALQAAECLAPKGGPPSYSDLLSTRKGSHGSALELLRWCVAEGAPCSELTAALSAALQTAVLPNIHQQTQQWQLARLCSVHRLARATAVLPHAVTLSLSSDMQSACDAAVHAMAAARPPHSSALHRDVALQVVKGGSVQPFLSEYRTGGGEVLDLAWVEHKIALEVQGPHHAYPGGGGHRVATADTALKRRLLESEGWSVHEVWFDEWQQAVQAGTQQQLLGRVLPSTVFKPATPPPQAQPSPPPGGGRRHKSRRTGHQQAAAPKAHTSSCSTPPPLRSSSLAGLDTRMRAQVITGSTGRGVAHTPARALHTSAAAGARSKRRGGSHEVQGPRVIDVEGGVVGPEGHRVGSTRQQQAAAANSVSDSQQLGDIDAVEAKLSAQLAQLQAGFGPGGEDDLERMHAQVQAGGGQGGQRSNDDLAELQQAQALMSQLGGDDGLLGGDFEAELRELFAEEAGGDGGGLADLGLQDTVLTREAGHGDRAAHTRAAARGLVDASTAEASEHAAALAAAKTQALEVGAQAAGVPVTRQLLDEDPDRTRELLLDGMQRLGLRPEQVFSEQEIEDALGYSAGREGGGRGRQGRRRQRGAATPPRESFDRQSAAAARSGRGLTLDEAVAAVGRDSSADVQSLADRVMEGEGGGDDDVIAASSLSQREQQALRRIRAQVEVEGGTSAELVQARQALEDKAQQLARSTGRGADLGQQAVVRAASGVVQAGQQAQLDATAAVLSGAHTGVKGLSGGGVHVVRGDDGLPALEGVDTAVAEAAALQALQDTGGVSTLEGGALPSLEGGMLSELIQQLRHEEAAPALGAPVKWECRRQKNSAGGRRYTPVSQRLRIIGTRTARRTVQTARERKHAPQRSSDDEAAATPLQQLGAALGIPNWEALTPSQQREQWQAAVHEAAQGVVGMAAAAGMSRSDMAQVFTQQLVPGIRAAYAAAAQGTAASAALDAAVQDFTEGALRGGGAMRLLVQDSPAAQALLDDIEKGILGTLGAVASREGTPAVSSKTSEAQPKGTKGVTWRQVDAACRLPSPSAALRMALRHTRSHAQHAPDAVAAVHSAGGRLARTVRGGTKADATAHTAEMVDASQAPANAANWTKERWARVHWHRLRRLGAVACAAGVPPRMLTAALRKAGVPASPAAINAHWKTDLHFTAPEPVQELDVSDPGAANVRAWQQQADEDGWVRQGGVTATPAQLAAFQDLLSGAGTRGSLLHPSDEEAQLDALLQLMRQQAAPPAPASQANGGQPTQQTRRWDESTRESADEILAGFDLDGVSQRDAAQLRSLVVELQSAATADNNSPHSESQGRKGSAATAARDADDLQSLGAQFMDSTGESILQSALQGMMQGASGGGDLSQAAVAGGFDARLMASMGGEEGDGSTQDAEAEAARIARDFADRTNSAAGGAAAAAEAVRPSSAAAGAEDVSELLRAHGLGEFEEDEEVQGMFRELLAAGASKGDLAAAMRAAGEEVSTAAQGWESDGEQR